MNSLSQTCDLVTTIAYFSIPLQIVASLYMSPKHRKIPARLIVTLILFALFIFLCGTGHLMRCLGMDKKKNTFSAAFLCVNVATAFISMITALYLIPLIPCMFSLLDESINRLSNESKESKSKLFTFMAFLCHEIRNPLFAITSSAEFLKDTALHPEQAEEVSSICDSSLLMLRLVNDVLDLSKLDSGKMELEAREFDLHSLLRRLGDNMVRQVHRKHDGKVVLNVDVSQDVPRIITGDSCRILQIVYNLLSNSCKFTSQGKIDLIVRLANKTVEDQEQEQARLAGAHTVTMSNEQQADMLSSNTAVKNNNIFDGTCSSTGSSSNDAADEKQLFSMALLENNNNADVEMGDSGRLLPKNINEDIVFLSIAVSDTGFGIPVDRLSTIFEPYTQAKLSDFRQHGGTGLGLSIIFSLIKNMGGIISVTSKAGEGTRFHLKIPVRVPHQPSFPLHHDDEEAHNSRHDHLGGGGDTGNTSQNLELRRLPVYEDGARDFKGGPLEDNGSTREPLFASGTSSSRLNGPPDLLSGPQSPTDAPPHTSTQRTRKTSPARTNNKHLPTAASLPSISLPTFEFPPESNLVLVVDDNSVNRKILGKMLKAFKLEYEVACNGKEAVDILVKSRNATGEVSRPRFGLVFMDVHMPVMDGNAAIAAIRKAKISVPIVTLSANVLSQERDRSIGLGADAFQSKPILRNDLHRHCTRFLYNDEYPAPTGVTIPAEHPNNDSGLYGLDDSIQWSSDRTGSLEEHNHYARRLSGSHSSPFLDGMSNQIRENPQIDANVV